MKTKIKHALVFASVAVLITLPLLALATARAHGGNRIDIGEEMRLFSPQAVHHQMIKLKYEKYQGPKENPKGDKRPMEGERVREVGRVEGEKVSTSLPRRQENPNREANGQGSNQEGERIVWGEKKIYAWVTAFTSEEVQTDSTPEISANGDNIWELYKKGEMTCASNIYPFGTRLHIENVGECVVRDRMNKRFDNTFRIDYYYGYDTKRAKQFGIKRSIIKEL